MKLIKTLGHFAAIMVLGSVAAWILGLPFRWLANNDIIALAIINMVCSFIGNAIVFWWWSTKMMGYWATNPFKPLLYWMWWWGMTLLSSPFIVGLTIECDLPYWVCYAMIVVVMFLTFWLVSHVMTKPRRLVRLA